MMLFGKTVNRETLELILDVNASHCLGYLVLSIEISMALLNYVNFLNELLELLLVFMINEGGLLDLFDFKVHPLNGVLRERSLLAVIAVEQVDGGVVLRVELRKVLQVRQGLVNPRFHHCFHAADLRLLFFLVHGLSDRDLCYGLMDVHVKYDRFLKFLHLRNTLQLANISSEPFIHERLLCIDIVGMGRLLKERIDSDGASSDF